MFSLLSRLFAAQSTTTKARRFQPKLEGLERRDAMSCTVGLQDGTLTVNGDANDNHVQIIQDDANNQFKVIADGVEHVFTSSQVNKLVVDLKEGDDTLSWKLGNGSNFKFSKEADIYLGAGEDTAQFDIGVGPLQNHWVQGSLDIYVDAGSEDDQVYANFGRKHGGTLSFVAALGDGNDEAHAALWGDVSGGADVYLYLYGQQGNDILNIWNTYDQDGEGYGGIDVAGDATVNLLASGGTENDTVKITHQGGLDGKLWLRAYGGLGNDSMDVDVLLTADSDGQADMAAKGDAGDDLMAFKFKNDAGADVAVLQALLDGGAGFDKYNWIKTSNNVAKANFEATYPIIVLV